MSEKFLGCHVSISGGFARALETAKRVNVNAIQIHPSAPQKWNTFPFKDGVEEEFLKLLPDSGVKRIFFHAIYLINLAHPEERMTKLSINSLKYDLDFNDRLGGHGVIVHVGSMKHESNESKGLKRAADSVNRILDDTKGRSPLLLEVAAGAGFTIGQKIEQLITIFREVENKERLGIALDTQHLWASGYELPQGAEQVINTVERELGPGKIKIVHVNDSKTALGSRVDRHENLGDGLIGFERLKQTLNLPALQSVPLVLETPGLKEQETIEQQVLKLREIFQ
jgi:deoxyribonuclease-4